VDRSASGAKARTDFAELPARLKRPLKKSSTQIPRGLKAARDDKNKGLRTAQLKLRPFKAAESDFFSGL